MFIDDLIENSLGTFSAILAAHVVRYRRYATETQRQQTKWGTFVRAGREGTVTAQMKRKPVGRVGGQVDDTFAELKPQIETLAEPLFGASEIFVRKRGEFLPHGAVLEADGEVRLMMAGPDDLDAPVSPAEILPRLHDALRADARDHDLAAVAVCEDVTITLAGQKPTKAVKVLVEHRRGLTVAMYLPWKRKRLGGHVFGEVMAMAARPEVQPWGDVGPPRNASS